MLSKQPAVIWFGYWAVRAYLSWYRYRNDLWVITNQRGPAAFPAQP